ncbi:lipopolysaccharide biosynthesis protein [Roseibium sp.]|uniref:lipopolysaccharide biosynthesis protein n=1 Tax=Roseibium sp. TaxID=1936156 RepID=UPI003A96F6C6
MRGSADTWANRLQRTAGTRTLALLIERAAALLDGDASRMALVTFSTRVLGAALAYVSQILLARWMGASDYGVFSVAWTWIIVLGIFACIGFSSSPNRFIPQYLKSGDLERLRGFLVFSRAGSLFAGLGLAAVGMVLVWVLGDHVSPDYVQPLTVILLALPLFALGGVQDGIARSYDWTSLAMLPTYIWRPLVIPALVLGLLLVNGSVSAFDAAVAAVAATWIVALYQLLALNRRLRSAVPRGKRTMDVPTWLLISLPMLLVEGFLQLIVSADVIMVSFWHSPDEVAVYFAASKTLALVHFVYFAVRAASAHRFASFIHSDDHDGLANYVHRASRWTFWLSLGTGLALLVVAPLLLSLFGEGFSSGYPILAVLLVGALMRAAVGPADALLSMSGHQKICAGIYGATFAMNVGLNLMLIPAFGLLGAAIATSISIAFEASSLAFAAWRRLEVKTFFLARAAVTRDDGGMA